MGTALLLPLTFGGLAAHDVSNGPVASLVHHRRKTAALSRPAAVFRRQVASGGRQPPRLSPCDETINKRRVLEREREKERESVPRPAVVCLQPHHHSRESKNDERTARGTRRADMPRASERRKCSYFLFPGGWRKSAHAHTCHRDGRTKSGFFGI